MYIVGTELVFTVTCTYTGTLTVVLKTLRPHFFYFMVYGFFFNKVKVGGGKKIKIKV